VTLAHADRARAADIPELHVQSRLVDSFSRARLSLEGLSLGDAFGETFFTTHDAIVAMVRERQPALPPWHWTDDTAMAVSIVAELKDFGAVDQDRLALRFAHSYQTEPQRGYGSGAALVLSRVAEGESWRAVAPGMFGGAGSFGNGAAMRVAPLGAYFADDLDAVVTQSRLSAEVTHSHPEGVAGAVAVAVAAAEMWRRRGQTWDGDSFLAAIIKRTPAGYTRDGIEDARALAPQTTVVDAAVALGNGTGVSAPDTVPFALWCAAAEPDSFEECLWLTAMGLGDVDTTCAIVGGIVVLRTGPAGLPKEWLNAREPLPAFPRPDDIARH
jgi:ADP-ribosylglycohydrolase